MAARVSFELPPARFARFLVGKPKAFPFVDRRRLPSVTGLLEALAGYDGESKFMVVLGREKGKRLLKRVLERRTKDGRHGIERCKKAQKTLSWGKGGCFGKSQQKLSLPQLPSLSHSFAFAPSDLVLPFCGCGDCFSRSCERGRSLDGNRGEINILPITASRCYAGTDRIGGAGRFLYVMITHDGKSREDSRSIYLWV
jgi:hypothetical protein